MTLEEAIPDPPTIAMSRTLLDNMLEHIARSKAIFKSQQIDDPEMSDSDKRRIAESVLFENPVAFLTRFGCYLSKEHLDLILSFKNDSNQYDLDFHVNRFILSLNDDSKRQLVRNRRFEALKRLQGNGSYFGDTEMEEREPLLYHQLVGQYLSAKDKYTKFRQDCSGTSTLSSLLIRQAENDELRERISQEQEEELESSEEDDDISVETSQQMPRWGDYCDEESNKRMRKKRKRKTAISKEEKQLLLQEFRTHVFTKFMDGLDVEFDYGSVDDNPEYDCLQLRGQDEEEKYFDEETCDESQCTDTGIEDY